MRRKGIGKKLHIIFPQTNAITLAIISLKWFTSTVFILPYLLLVLYPGQILVDNGHFQYNNTSLGLFLFAVACVMQSQYIWSSFFFTLALNYKQMELYHALPFFVYLLKACFLEKVTFRKIIRLIQLGFVTLTTFFLLWMPWISSLDSLTSTILRLFPLKRGVFEDKVANVWCTFNAVYNLKENFHNEQMALICLVATLFAILPSNVHLYFKFQKEIFLCSLANTSISFFLFSYQVHEKSILLAAIPVCFLFNSLLFLVLCFLKISILSLFPLLIKDNLCVIYFCMIILYMLLFKFILQLNYCKNEKANISLRLFMDLFDVSILIISTATLLISPPARFPYIWSFFISSLSCIYFTFFLCASNLFQYYLFEPYGCFRYFIDVGLKYMQ
ncbi:ALG6 alpha-1,3-glucosyltransferase garnysstan isoform 3-T5 [Cochliomyia hominivorax]